MQLLAAKAAVVLEWLRQRYRRRRSDQHPFDIFERDRAAFGRQERPARGIELAKAHFMERPPAGDLEVLRIALDRHLAGGRGGGV